ncbi:hypothetical protein [Bythopirellula goksoeyrii]|uniref:STAS domain-containing protein n=1 Tax=Bythopirellula goksoeyrii TaxID=1400387 RepID=A0A5B9QKV6_9BACT|nr:hypothetical protein [Bythopirellula goksoeyrii]QEG34703.1 hypothetical protein Pr1d_19850 [Bythopirellula goksoeyrii]
MSVSTVSWIDKQTVEGVCVLTVNIDRLDKKLHPRKEFAQLLDDAVAAGERRFVLNLSKFRITNHTYGILQLAFTIGNVLHNTGSRVAVCGLKGHPRRAYLFANVERFIPEFLTQQQAIDAVKNDAVREH